MRIFSLFKKPKKVFAFHWMGGTQNGTHIFLDIKSLNHESFVSACKAIQKDHNLSGLPWITSVTRFDN